MAYDDLVPDLERANAARMYDYLLGGAHNFAVDREAAEHALARRADLGEVARANRRFLGRVVRRCLDEGIGQFLDLGSGVPTVGNVHEIAHAGAPDARVAYVDIEPVAVAAGRSLVAGSDLVTVTHGDLRDPAAVLGAPTVAQHLDLTRPVAVLAVAVLHFVPGDLTALLAGYRDALVPGSVLALSHGSDDVDDPELAARVRAGVEAYRGTASEAHLRTRAEIVDALGGADALLPPGLVDLEDWPDAQDTRPATGMVGAVARIG
ncbi:O-methyltransferase involved in polyketide biosynthesis [Pseudonocardia sediminis]|uniref:O-methyltransferase involved in polyketide biosynthesis n=1 Tax=Pseudonocardia sediminis TaxID=1397368 RepID=A0A4Q7UY92_PSEST|nr:SAM-dependent methyltransferase [Pseudonocardia sediminis]RZT86775.1 O-methyltransferase involved in polyketide biosynthesis [Pseudonocardia sediminis]